MTFSVREVMPVSVILSVREVTPVAVTFKASVPVVDSPLEGVDGPSVALPISVPFKPEVIEALPAPVAEESLVAEILVPDGPLVTLPIVEVLFQEPDLEGVPEPAADDPGVDDAEMTGPDAWFDPVPVTELLVPGPEVCADPVSVMFPAALPDCESDGGVSVRAPPLETCEKVADPVNVAFPAVDAVPEADTPAPELVEPVLELAGLKVPVEPLALDVSVELEVPVSDPAPAADPETVVDTEPPDVKEAVPE